MSIATNFRLKGEALTTSEVVQAGGSAVDPVHDVVGVAGDREAVTTRERAVLVAQHQRDPDRGGDQALQAADVEDLGPSTAGIRSASHASRRAASADIGSPESIPSAAAGWWLWWLLVCWCSSHR